MATLQDTAKDLIDRGAQVVSSLAASAGDAASRTKIRLKIGDLGLEHDKLMKELGKAAYEDIKENAKLAGKHADLIGKIDEVDAHKAALEEELAKMSANAQADEPVDVEAIAVTQEVDEPAADGADPADKDAQ